MSADLGQVIKTSFFLQFSFVCTYVPMATALLALMLVFYARWSFLHALLTSLQWVITAYGIVLIGSAMFALLLNYYGHPLISSGMKRPLHYHAAVLLSAMVYGSIQVLLLSGQKTTMPAYIAWIILLCNGVTAVIMMGLHYMLFVRHI